MIPLSGASEPLTDEELRELREVLSIARQEGGPLDPGLCLAMPHRYGPDGRCVRCRALEFDEEERRSATLWPGV